MQTININCPHCLTTNRLPKERLGEGPDCGKCKQALFSQQVLELSPDNLAPTLNRNDIPVLVDCWAPWCGPCKNFAPIFEQAAQIFEPQLRLAKLNTEEHQQIAQSWQIRSIPTLILIRQGKEVQRISGAMNMQQLHQWLQQNGVEGI